jgi:hypothetical protein
MKLAPVLLFTYKRLSQTIQTIGSLQRNALAGESELVVFSDGPKNDGEFPEVKAVRDYVRTITGFKKVTILEADKNTGLANSIINGVSKLINEHGKVIVLEDDLELSPNFLAFMNAALRQYEKTPLVYSISGFAFDLRPDRDYPYDVFFTRRHCSWGWAMWKDRWNEIDWDVRDYPDFIRSSSQQRSFNRIGTDLATMLKRQMNGKLDSWAIRCMYHQFKKNMYTVYPLKSKVINRGFGDADATHTKRRFNQYSTNLDIELKYKFNLPESVFEDRTLLGQFTGKFSIITRSRYFIKNKISQLTIIKQS